MCIAVVLAKSCRVDVAVSVFITPVTRDEYVQLAAEIEEFRRQNAAMAQELARRDLFNNSLRYRLASFLLSIAGAVCSLPTSHTKKGWLTCGRS